MIVILKRGTPETEVNNLAEYIKEQGVSVSTVVGTDIIILGLVGDTSKIDPSRIEADHNVERVMHVAEPYKKANKMFHPQPSVVKVGDTEIGGSRIA
ncbi:MAG: 3-deoxy-7-phosphoheptulonate synthase, partial [Oscillospiraceae bacterium]|nr:3-deoxy-7-phosphoheptulonate synthase [Oscillospiraceae bacterium]